MADEVTVTTDDAIRFLERAVRNWTLPPRHRISNEDIEDVREALAAFVVERRAIPEGYVLVPVEPTAAMLGAADCVHGDANIYRTMIAARPKGEG